MRRKLLTLGLGFAVAAAMVHGGVAGAVCDMPLVITHSSGDANVLIILDNSGSMNEAIVSPDYNKATNWSGNFSRTSTYSISTDNNYTPRSFKSSWPNTPSAYLVNSDLGKDGDYDGNYLNWVYFHATVAQRAAIPRVTRIQSAKAAVNTVLANTSGCVFGLMDFNGDNGGKLLAPMGTSVASIQTTINGIRAETYTPLGETMVTALDYYKTTGVNAPILGACQKSFIVLVTDGLPTRDDNRPSYIVDANRDGQWLDDAAAYLYRQDLRADLDGIQNVASFVIGFNVDANLLRETADKGGGTYYSVTDGAACAAALTDAFEVIAKRVAAGASVSVVSSEDRVNNRLFRARYESQTWRGYVESFSLPFHSGDAPLWESGALLASRSPDSRTILTSSTGTNTAAFATSNASILQSLLGAANVTEASNIIQYVRGTDLAGTRDRGGWRLGDIVDAAPVMVTRPMGFINYLNYQAFKTANASRNEVLFVAANDGMMHCLDVDDGSELWAYVPKTELAKLKDLMSVSYCHEYFVNLTPGVFDIYVGGAWKTVLVGGEERGGSGLFAIDVTIPDPNYVSVMWDVNLPALNGSWNTPTLVRDRTLNKQVICVGTGYAGGSAQANLLAIDPANGSVLKTLALGSPTSANKTTRATTIDTDFDGFDDVLYLGDLTGRVWRVNLNVNPWTVSLLFNAGKPIQAAPVVTMDTQGRPMVFFGTGRFLDDSDPGNTETQRFFGIIDDGSGATVSISNLVDQTSSINAATTGNRGWYMNLANPGERITRTAAVIAGTIYVPTYLPNSGACTGGGQSWLYSLDYKDGSAPNFGNGAENNTVDGRIESMGDGILADPSVDLVNEDVLLQSSNAVLITQNISGSIKKLIVRSWRQKLN